MSLQDWLAAKWLTACSPTPAEVRNLLAVADRELRDAAVAGLSDEGRFSHAYTAANAAATAALLAAGYEVSRGTSHHHLVIQSLKFTISLDDGRIRALDAFRKLRNASIYDRPEGASAREADAMTALATEVRAASEAAIRASHPGFLAGT
jgi:hypothetical protein